MTEKKQYEIVLVTKEPIRIGGKTDPLSGAENPVMRVGGKIVVPGPSLKGALRNEVERFLIEKYYDTTSGKWPNTETALKPCIPATKLSKDEEELVKQGKYKIHKAGGCHYPCDTRPHKCENDKHTICPVCYFSGAQGLPGFVRVPFLFSDVGWDELYSSRLDRATGTVVHGTNRPYSVVPNETTFKGILEVIIKDDVLNWELGKPRNLTDNSKGDAWLNGGEWNQEKIIKELIVGRLENIELIGGYKSKGCGKVEISVREIG
jgi:CRISPR/Cas system CSM-associated protein Csm3 (group 7 of RAMP superfamily)